MNRKNILIFMALILFPIFLGNASASGVSRGSLSGTPINIGITVDMIQDFGLNDEFELRALELNIGAPVDPYFELITTISWHEGEFEVEEAFVSAILPLNLKVHVGRELLPFGYLNRIHEHDFPQADQPYVIEGLTTDHGLIGNGGHIEYLAPFYNPALSLTFGLYNNIEESIGRRINGLPALGRLQAYWEHDSHALLAGISYLNGIGDRDHMEDRLDENGETTDARALGKIRHASSLDIKYRYRPDGKTYRGLTIGGEYLRFNYNPYENHADIESDTEIGNDSGFYAYIQWDFDRFWGVGYRYDNTDVLFSKIHENSKIIAHSLYGEWRATEFSRLRLQYQNFDASKSPDREHLFFIQGTFIIGWHPPHRF